jgi:SAM-dependent methyltransferase
MKNPLSVTAAEGIHGRLEYPVHGMSIHKASCVVAGWAFSDRNDELSVRIKVDGREFGGAKWGLARFDVFGQYQKEPAYESGFLAKMDIGKLETGLHTLSVVTTYGNEELLIGESEIRFEAEYTTAGDYSRYPSNQTGEIWNFDQIAEYAIPAGANAGSVRIAGKKLLEQFVRYGNLQPFHRALEIGCGFGRFAVPITRYLTDEKGEFYGLDILPSAVEYLRNHVAARYKNFHIDLADVYNNLYNPRGRYRASDYRLPYPDNHFDFILLQSVFTHLVRDDMKNYLCQIGRVLKKGGTCFITYFLLNRETHMLIKNETANRKFPFQFDGYRSDSQHTPEIAIAFEENLIRELYDGYNLQISDPIYYGSWRGLSNTMTSQDVVIAVKA